MTTKKQIAIGLGAAFALIFVLATVKFFQISAAIAEGKARKQPPTAVTSMITVEEEWPQILTAVATLSPVLGATLSAEEVGRVASINFTPGNFVKSGEVLVALDTAVEEASLKSAKAQLALAQSNAVRQRALRQRNVNSESDLDDAENNLLHATAEVERLTAVIARKQIIAPFDGVTGINLVKEGQLLTVGTAVVSLQSFDSLYADFSLPQSALGSLATGAQIEVKVDAFPKEVFTGTLDAIDSQVDASTRNIKLRGAIANTELKLRPGMFADVSVVLPEKDRVISIPASSINYAPYGNSVFVIQETAVAGEDAPMLTVQSRVVTLGRMRGDQISVLSGLTPGEQIVTGGTFRLRPDAPVIVNNSVTPGNNPAPTPPNT